MLYNIKGEQRWVGRAEKRGSGRRYAEGVSATPTDMRCRVLPMALSWSTIEIYQRKVWYNPQGTLLVSCRILPAESWVASLSRSTALLSSVATLRAVACDACFLASFLASSLACLLACLLACSLACLLLPSTQTVALAHPHHCEFYFFRPCLVYQGRKIKNFGSMLRAKTSTNNYSKKLLHQRI